MVVTCLRWPADPIEIPGWTRWALESGCSHGSRCSHGSNGSRCSHGSLSPLSTHLANLTLPPLSPNWTLGPLSARLSNYLVHRARDREHPTGIRQRYISSCYQRLKLSRLRLKGSSAQDKLPRCQVELGAPVKEPHEDLCQGGIAMSNIA